MTEHEQILLLFIKKFYTVYNKSMQQNRLLIIMLAFIFVFIGIVIGLIIYLNANDTPIEDSDIALFPTPVPILYTSPDVVSIDPPITTALLPGKDISFLITFTTSIREKPVKILLTRKPIIGIDESINSVSITSELTSFGKALSVTLQEPILPAQEYSLIVLGANDKTLVSSTYTSSSIEILRAPQNNPDLQQFLPYETPTFRLTYNENRNSYIFNFKINPNSTESLESQFNQAKQQAESYIRSKGIDINTIVIEWRRS